VLICIFTLSCRDSTGKQAAGVLQQCESLSRQRERNHVIHGTVGDMGDVINIIITPTVVMTGEECVSSFCRFTS